MAEREPCPWKGRRGRRPGVGGSSSRLILERLEDRCTPSRFAVTDLGTLGGPESYAWGLNNQGQVVGDSLTASGQDHCFIWQKGQMTDLGTLGGDSCIAFAINNYGQVAGQSMIFNGIDKHAFVWRNGVFTNDLGTLGGPTSGATGINDAGFVTGQSDLASGNYHAFIWDPGTSQMTDMGTLGGTVSAARGINSLGQVVGGSFTGNSSNHAYIWYQGVMTDLGSILGGKVSKAYAINSAGWIVGTSNLPGDGVTHAFLAHDGIGTDLGTFGGPDSFARAINAFGQIVGDAAIPDGTHHGFLWQNGVMTDLNQMISASSGWVVATAYGINFRGQIAAWATKDGGPTHAVLLSPRFATPPGPWLTVAPTQHPPGGSGTQTQAYASAGAVRPPAEPLPEGTGARVASVAEKSLLGARPTRSTRGPTIEALSDPLGVI
jgi:probable HAF family extracellular repeat protein